MKKLFGNISESTISREIRFLSGILYQVLPLFNTVFDCEIRNLPCYAVVDCTSHIRNRVHPGQAFYYRCDKHSHFITVQVVYSENEHLYQVKLAFGHNNDSGMLIITGVKE